ncbi:Cryptochrome DASH [Neorhodopirellula pilleata]|uniref:Cryptochrome DASH n=2 Tax=Neorhodopirellula pilleata TaxID=2714738 RepID=A0A5C6AVI6_9BACT|nr:Cryptochrome DASH [Neorhodopirellula pilleata]
MANCLVWFRNDLRTHDHEPLRIATEHAGSGGNTFALYCFDPRQFGRSRFGFDRTGPHRTRFLIESVADLRDQLRRLGGELIVRHGKPEETIEQLIQELSIDSVHYHREPGTEEYDIEQAVELACQRGRVRTVHRWAGTLHLPEDLPFEIAQVPEIFTHYRKSIEKSSSHRDPLAAPDSIHCRLPECCVVGDLPGATELGVEPPKFDERSHRDYRGGQTAGMERLQEYLWDRDRLRVYKQTRNGMLAVDDSSKFSPWLANGSLSPRTIAAEVSRYERERVANESTYWLIFELMWRDYFHFIAAKHGRHLFQIGGLQQTQLPWLRDVERMDAWKQGRTGYPLVDANMQELAATGFMSNRGRQNVGSFLTKNLGIDWRMGAEWFESLLIDYDVASNYGNWNYVAGVGNDARGFRFFNITKQARDYDPDGDYVRHWLPVLANIPSDRIHEPWKLSREDQARYGVQIGREYPTPIVDLFVSVGAIK